MNRFACSVVIPTHGRAQSLDIVLAALAAQITDEPFEVIVVLDGSSADSERVLETWERLDVFASFRWYVQEQKGAAAARNRGAFLARAPILVFLDDDVVPEPDLISRYLSLHSFGERIAVLGDYEIVRGDPSSLCDLAMWSWWEDLFHRRAAEWQPVSYRYLCTGNVSMRREDFARVGGFDQDFGACGREDYELGYRLLRSGVRFVADRSARARHQKATSIAGWQRLARTEGLGDVLIARKHPELTRGLPLMGPLSRRQRRAAGLAMWLPLAGRVANFLARRMLAIEERLHLRGRWLRRVDFLLTYAYWSGLREALGSMKAVRTLRRGAPTPPRQELDVAAPLGPQVQALDIDAPGPVIVTYRGDAVGSLEIDPSLREPVLPWLVREISYRFSATMLLRVAEGRPDGWTAQGDGRQAATRDASEAAGF
jgi:GT2 family glycosyltransferase